MIWRAIQWHLLYLSIVISWSLDWIATRCKHLGPVRHCATWTSTARLPAFRRRTSHTLASHSTRLTESVITKSHPNPLEVSLACPCVSARSSSSSRTARCIAALIHSHTPHLHLVLTPAISAVIASIALKSTFTPAA